MFNLRYSRQIALKEISAEGHEKLSRARVCIVGMGATGSPAADLFVRSGIEHLRIIDADTVDISNIHRQVLYSEKDVGVKKVEAARSRLLSVNGKCSIEAVDNFLDSSNVDELLSGYNIVIDGTDNMETRRIVNRYCVNNGIPWIFVSSIGTVAQVKAVIPGKTSCLECFVPNETIFNMSCEETGVLASSPVIASSMAWTLSVNILTGNHERGDLYHIDPWSRQWETIEIKKNPQCNTCSRVNET